MPLATLPSPTTAVWHLGPFPITAFGLFVLLGILTAAAITETRLRKRGAPPWLAADVAVVAVPLGLIGARLWHVVESPGSYFGPGGHPAGALRFWEGGSLWGALAFGALGAWLVLRRRGTPLAAFADAAALGLPVGQAIGRVADWFLNTRFGRPTDLPWGLTVYRFDPRTGQAIRDDAGLLSVDAASPVHPVFLYEIVWNIGVAVLVYVLERRWRLSNGRAFALYLGAYAAGRFWIESFRADDTFWFAGIRLNAWIALAVGIGALIYFLRVRSAPGPLPRAAVPDRADATVGLSPAPRPADRADRPVAERARPPDGTDTVVLDAVSGQPRRRATGWLAQSIAVNWPRLWTWAAKNRTSLTTWGTVGVVAGLAVALVVSQLWAGARLNRLAADAARQVAEAEQQRQQTAEELRLMVARQLTQQATDLLASDPRQAVKLAYTALSIWPGLDEALAVVVPTLLNNRISTLVTDLDSAVSTAELSPDGTLLVTGTESGAVQLWDLTGSYPVPSGDPLVGHGSPVHSAAFSPDGNLLVTGGGDGRVFLWNVTDRTAPVLHGLRELERRAEEVHGVAISPDGRMLATAAFDGVVVLWDISDRDAPQEIASITQPDRLYAVDFAPDGRTLATSSRDSTVVLWNISDPATPRRARTIHAADRESVNSVVFSPDGTLLATASDDRTVSLWNAATGSRIASLTLPGNALGVTFSPDGQNLAAVGANGQIRVWRIADQGPPRELFRFSGQDGDVRSVAFTPDGMSLATGAADRTVVLWDMRDGTVGRATPIGAPVTGHPAPVWSAAFSPDGTILATAGEGGTVMLWDVTDVAAPAQLGQPLPGHSGIVYSVAFSPDGRILATTGSDRTTRLWDISDPANPRRLGDPLIGHGAEVLAVAFSPDGTVLATGSADATVMLWNVADAAHPERLGLPLGTSSGVMSLSFTGTTVAAGRMDGLISVWDVRDPSNPVSFADIGRLGQLEEPFVGHTDEVRSLVASPGGRTLVSAGKDGRVILWDYSGPARARQLGPPLAAHSGPVWAAAYSPNGLTLATAGTDGQVILWDVADRAHPSRLTTLTAEGKVHAVAFSPDGRTLATAGSDNAVTLWDLGPVSPRRDSILTQVCRYTGDGLTESEWAFYVGPSVAYFDPCANPPTTASD
jgi:prolipoprotein diacylglyceryl transferase